MLEIGERIRQLRIHKSLTQKELINGICSITYLSRIENGQIKPSHSFLLSISERLGIDLDDLTYINSSDNEEKIKRIVYWYKEKGELSEADLSFLQIQTLELHPSHIYLQLFGVLLQDYIKNGKIGEAQSIYDLSTKFVPVEIDASFEEDFYYYYLGCGKLYYHRQDYLQANQYYMKAEKLIEDSTSIESAKLYYNISLVKQRLFNNIEVCLYYSYKSYAIFKKHNETENIVIILITLGVQHQLNNNLEEAINCLNEAIELVENTDNSECGKYLAMIEYNFGRIYAKKRDLNVAIKHYQDSIKINEQIASVQEQIHSYVRLIEIYIELKEWKMVDKYLKTAIKITKSYDLNYDYIQLNLRKISVYKLQGEEIIFEKRMQKMLDYAYKNNQILIVKQIAKELGTHFYEKKAYKKAADYYWQTLICEEKITELTKHPSR